MPMTHGTAWGALILRVVLGVIFIMHAYLGYAVVTPKGMTALLARMGIPSALLLVLAWYIVIAHAAGGVLMIVGLWTRLAALLNIPIMFGAVAMLHYAQGFFMKGVIVDAAAGRAIVAGYEFPLLVLACTVAVALIGAGPLSVDHQRRAAPGRRR